MSFGSFHCLLLSNPDGPVGRFPAGTSRWQHSTECEMGRAKGVLQVCSFDMYTVFGDILYVAPVVKCIESYIGF